VKAKLIQAALYDGTERRLGDRADSPVQFGKARAGVVAVGEVLFTVLPGSEAEATKINAAAAFIVARCNRTPG
jgi:hypothetical protein